MPRSLSHFGLGDRSGSSLRLAFGAGIWLFRGPYQIEYLALLPDGSTKPVYVHASFTTTLSYLIYFVLVAILMSWFSSSRRRAERLLDQARSDLEVKVEERTADLSQANQQLRNEIAKRNRVAEALRRSEAYLAEAQRLSLTGSFDWKVPTGEVTWSEEHFRIFQYDLTMTPSVELIVQRVYPEDAALVKQTVERAAQDGKDFDFEHRLLMPDGSVKYVHVVAHALSDESGSIEYVDR